MKGSWFERHNIVRNLLLVALFCVLAMGAGGCGGGSSSTTKPYKTEPYTTFKMSYNQKEFKVLQLTDVHLSGASKDVEGTGLLDQYMKITAYNRDQFALQTIDELIKATNPDLIAVTGDVAFVNENFQKYINIGHNDNLRAIKVFAEAMEKYKIPWTIVFGNHDAEGLHGRDEIGTYLESLEYCLFKKGPDEVDGVGNYIINVENNDGTLNKTLFFIDSHSYIPGQESELFPNKYDSIHPNQIAWYEKTLNDVAKEYKLADGKLPESLAYFHIPLTEYKTAWNLYKTDPANSDIEYVYGTNGEETCSPFIGEFNSVTYDGGKLFDKMVKLGSTKATFAGHDHINISNIKYKGIYLVYGKSIDYIAYAPIDTDKYRGATMVSIKNDGSFTIVPHDYNGGLYLKYLASLTK